MQSFLIYSFVVTISIISFNFSYIFSGFNRVFAGIYKGGLESCVLNFDVDGSEILPYFNVSKTRDTVEQYLATNLVKYAPNYTVEFQFYDRESGLVENYYPDEVDIYVTAEIAYLGDYTKSSAFYIEVSEIWTK